jgi:hypothetical protein
MGAVSGAATTVTVVHLYTNDLGGYWTSTGVYGPFVDDELWVQSTSGCSPNCWVEAGMSSVANGRGNPVYFWADQRPGGGYHEHIFTEVPSGDYGHTATLDIRKTSSSTFTAAIYTYTSSYYGYSTANQMSPGYVDAGSELSGSGSAYPLASQAPRADFTHNEFVDGSGNYHYQDYHHYNPGSGPLYAGGAPPPYLTVVSIPNGSTNSGGDFYTQCC